MGQKQAVGQRTKGGPDWAAVASVIHRVMRPLRGRGGRGGQGNSPPAFRRSAGGNSPWPPGPASWSVFDLRPLNAGAGGGARGREVGMVGVRDGVGRSGYNAKRAGPRGGRLSSTICAAVSYSPARPPSQYHRR